MSGFRVASYRISEAELARQREAARQQTVRRDWALLQRERAALRQQVAEIAGRYGLPTPRSDGLADLIRLDEETVARLARQARGETAVLRRDITELVVFGRAKVARAQASGIGPARQAVRTGPAPSTPAVAARSDATAPDTGVASEIVKRLRALEAGVLPTAPIERLVADLEHASIAQRQVLLAALRQEVDRANTRAKRRRDMETLVLRAEILAEDLHDAALTAAVRDARHAMRQDAPVDTDGLRREMADAEARYAAQQEREFVRGSIVDAFEKLGYAVVGTPTVDTPDGGVLVRRGSGASHGVEIAVHDGVIDVEPIQLVDLDAPLPHARDAVAEQKVCDDTAGIWDAVAESGINVGKVNLDGPASAPFKPVRTRRGKPTKAVEHAIDIEGERERAVNQ